MRRQAFGPQGPSSLRLASDNPVQASGLFESCWCWGPCTVSSEQPTPLEKSSIKYTRFLTCSALPWSEPCVSSNRKYPCLCRTLQLASSKRLFFALMKETCSSQGNSVQMYPNLHNFSSHSLSFTSVCARRDAELHQEPKLVLGVAALQALQAWYLGCQSMASNKPRHHVFSHDCWEVAPKSHDPDTHSRFIHR